MRRRALPLPACAVLFALVAAACGLPRLSDYHRRPLAQTTFVYAADGSLITTLHASQDRVVLTQGQMPQSIRDAAVAIEDRRFYYHHGFDLHAIMRAAVDDATAGQTVEGGSTITQQLVKNLYVGGALTLRRKIDEAALAWQLEDRLSKSQILTKYLNTVYFGEGAYGVQAAAETYFAKSAKNLTLAESAMLAGLITSPNHFDPYVNPASALGRRNVVLRLMRQQGYIDGASRLAAQSRPLAVQRRPTAVTRYPYPYFMDYFERWFLNNPAFGATYADRKQLLFTGGLRVQTTVDPTIQREAESAVGSVLAYPGDPDAALTAIDPTTGFVRAMVGGKDADYWTGKDAGRVNLATGAGGSGRQTGSAFKPFALVTALEKGISPETIYPAPASIDIPEADGSTWDVTNAEGNGYGDLSLADATVYSVNTVYAQVIHELGAANVVATAERMGLRCCTNVGEPRTPLHPYDSAVLGTNEVNTLEMASAYGTLATGGQHVQPVPAVSITDALGNVVWQAHPDPQQVVDPKIASVADGILRNVVLYGTGKAANIGRPQIGKTGTAQNFANAWYVGAVPQLVASVWVGFHQGNIDMVPPTTRIAVYGGTWPAQIWRLFMLRATTGMAATPFPVPRVGYVSEAVDITQDPYCLPNRYTLPVNIRTVQFFQGTQPTKVCATPTASQPLMLPSVIGLHANAAIAVLERAGFNVQVSEIVSTQPPGSVVSETPSAGTTALSSSTVRLKVARAPDASG